MIEFIYNTEKQWGIIEINGRPCYVDFLEDRFHF